MDALNCLGPAKRLYSEVIKLITLLRILPATSATAERIFSTLRILKTYLRATMEQERLNNLMILHIYSTDTDNLNLDKVASNFISLNDHRRSMFCHRAENKEKLLRKFKAKNAGTRQYATLENE